MFKTVINGILLSSAVFLSGHTFASIPCTAEDLEKLPKHLRSEASLNGQSVKIEVTIPGDKFISRCAVSPLEYGDMISYSFGSGHEVVVELTVENPLSFFHTTKRIFKLKHLSLEPSLLAVEREKFPYSVRIWDAQAKIAYDIYLNRDGHPVMTRAHMKSL